MLRYRSVILAAIASLCAVSLLGVMGGRHSQIKVTSCSPSRGMTTVTPGFAPAYYPPNPYYWNTVYGRRYYQPRVSTSRPALSVDYVNVGEKVANSIEFGLVARGALVAEVRDVGTFSPGAEIKHEFGLSPNVFPLGTGLAQCVPLKVVYKDGTKWTNPHLPALRRSAGM